MNVLHWFKLTLGTVHKRQLFLSGEKVEKEIVLFRLIPYIFHRKTNIFLLPLFGVNRAALMLCLTCSLRPIYNLLIRMNI